MSESGDTSAAGAGAARRKRDPEATTKRLLEAAVAEFIEHGFDKAVVSDIARRAGMTAGAVYGRWPHKTDVVLAALDHLFEQLLPAERVEQLGLAEMSVPAIFEGWGASLLDADSVRDALVLAFGVRGDDAIQARLRQFLNEQSDQIGGLIERGKSEGTLHPELNTVAVALLVQAIGIGTHILISAGLDDRRVPSAQDWTDLLGDTITIVGQRQ